MLDRDLFAIEPDTISHTQVLKAVLQGREVCDQATMPHPLERWDIPYTPGIYDCAPVGALNERS